MNVNHSAEEADVGCKSGHPEMETEVKDGRIGIHLCCVFTFVSLR